MKDEKKLLKRLIKKDEEAFEYFYYKYVKLIFHIIYSMIKNKEDTNDLVQDSFITLLDKIEEFNPNNNLKYYLVTIAKNKAIDYLRKNKRVIVNNDIINLRDETKSSFDEMMEQYKEIITVDEFNIITLHLFNNLKFREIASIYNKTTSSVNNIYIRGIKKIKNYLKGSDYHG